MPAARRRPAPPRPRPAATPSAGPAAGRLVPAAALAATLAAVLERWWFPRAWAETTSVASAFYHGDVPAFVAFARAIAVGEPYDNGIPFHPPGWPWTLSWLVGLVTTAATLKLVAACLSGLTVGLAVLLAWRIAGRGAMLATALLGPFHFGHIVAGSTPNSEALYGLLVVASLVAAERWLTGAGDGGDDAAARVTGWATAAGALAGLAAVVRAEFLLGGLLLVAAGAWTGRARRWHPAVACAVAFGLVLLPPTVANWRSLSAFNAAHTDDFPGPLPRLALVTSYGAFNFAMANHERADGGPNRDHPLLDACSEQATDVLDSGGLELACPAAYRLYVDGYGIGLGWLLGHPLDAAALWWRKADMALGAFAQGYMADDVGAGVDGVRRRVDMLDPAGRLLLPVHLLLFAGGLYLLARGPRAWLLAVPLATLAASTLLFYGYVRLVIPYLPIVWICQGAALAALGARFTPAAWSRRAPAIVLAVGLGLLAVEGVRVGAPRAVTLDGPHLPDGSLAQDETLTVRRVPTR
ncbi:MAG: hypothetical protein AB7H88_12365 [Vicinamibacterales bacterium]